VTPLTPLFPTALTIAGSDPSGGAGIQADLKTFHNFEVYGTTAITLLTVQNTCGVSRVEIMPVDLVMQQIQAVLEDIPASAAKTGALGSAEMIEAIGAEARHWTFPLVVDPVLFSKHGAPLASRNSVEAYRKFLIPYADVLMPNIPEAEELCGFSLESPTLIERAAKSLLDLGAKSVVIKGGHLEGDPIDLYFDSAGHRRLPAKRIQTQNTHGTGCTYAAAAAAGLARGKQRFAAIRAAKKFVTAAIRANFEIGHGIGPLNHWV